MSSKHIKKRNWACVVYPDSAPTDWRDILAQTGLQCAISPLHDRDIDPDGNPKKPHWHVILCYAGPTSYSVVCKLTEQLHAPIPQVLEQVRGYYRYFTHMDNPDKAQYDVSDITTINGFSVMDYSELTRSEVDKVLMRLTDCIDSANITEYAVLMRLLRDSGDTEGWSVARSNTLFLNTYIKSSFFAAGKKQDDSNGKSPIRFPL